MAKNEKIDRQIREVYSAMPKSIKRKGDGTVAEMIVDEVCKMNRFTENGRKHAAPAIRESARNIIREHRLKTLFGVK